MRNEIIELASSYIGLNEADGSHRKIIDLYNSISPLPRGYRMSYSDPWCAAFISALGEKLQLGYIVLPECSCDAMIALYKAKGLWIEADSYTPLPGDIIMYDWQDSDAGDNTGSADHVGIVESVSGGTMIIIEGNISDRVDRRRLAVNGKFIRGYCVPEYDKTEDDSGEIIIVSPPAQPPTTTVSPQGKATGDKFTVALRYLRRGDTGEDVESLQWELFTRGYDIGKAGIDGKFGRDTEEGLKDFQRANRIEPDGEFGPDTFGMMWGA